MYQITYDHYILYDPRFATAEDKLMITEPDVYLAVGKAGEMSFVLQPDHPYLDRLQRMKGVVSLLDDGVPVYRGRITKDNATYYGSRKITTEGLMACLNDSVMPPFSFPSDVEEDEEYQKAAASGNVVEYFFRWVLARHNAQVSEAQQIKPGVCTVTDSNNYIARSSTEYLPTMEVLTTRLPKSALGGHLLIRYEADGNYLDYYADLPLTNTQRVEYAANLLDIVSERDGTEIYTSILPVGKDGLTIADIADGDLTDDLVKDGLTVYSRSGVAAYGRINRYVRWDDVTVVDNLLAKAKASVSSSGLATQESITVQAVDLGWQDSVQHFRVGRMTLLVSTPHGYNAAYALMELQPDILSPGNTRITLGATRRTFTGSQIDAVRKAEESAGQVRTDLNKKIEDIELTPGPPGPAGADGKDGTNGLSVWITYHDDTTTPATPTGNGTLNGWHTDLTSAVVWMSQKVAASATAGAWGAPIRLLGEKGEQGIQGIPGEKGDPGKDGSPGATGPQGPQGEKGATGQQGVSVTATTVEYYLSASDTELSGGAWQSTAPAITDGKYLWGRTKITYSNGQTAYTGAYCISKAMAESAKPQIDQVTKSTMQQITDVQQSLNSIILTALQNYVETGEFGSYKEEISSKLEMLADKLSINITKVTEHIDKVNGDLQSKYSEIKKAFNFTDEGLFIGETGNEILLRLDNDVMQFVRNNTPELMLTAAGVETHQVKVTTLIIGNVAFMADGSGDVVVKGVK